jgi:hypothetical protein
MLKHPETRATADLKILEEFFALIKFRRKLGHDMTAESFKIILTLV